jgi:hypothetical protein
MPKKKLTKTSVKRKIKIISKNIYDLLLDKMGHGSASFIPFSKTKMLELNDYFTGGLNQVLRKKY